MHIRAFTRAKVSVLWWMLPSASVHDRQLGQPSSGSLDGLLLTRFLSGSAIKSTPQSP